jgi:hypothetical protein
MLTTIGLIHSNSKFSLDAEHSARSLRNQVDQRLEIDMDLRARSEALRRSVTSRPVSQISLLDSDDEDSDSETATIRNTPSANEEGSDLCTTWIPCHDFEKELEASRVYRSAQQSTCDASFTSSDVRSHAWSNFTAVSLSRISCLAVVALPLSLDELQNLCWDTDDSPLWKEILHNSSTLDPATVEGKPPLAPEFPTCPV